MGRMVSLALGQGQAPAAQRLVEEGARSGCWVFLANCHLMPEWLPTLDKILDKLEAAASAASTVDARKVGAVVHEQFRLWLSSAPTDAFPATLLQRSVKVAVEPPSGLRANMMRLYEGISEDRFESILGGDKGGSKGSSTAAARYQRLLFCLAFFHASILERRKFGTLGFNTPYDFSQSDFT